MRVGMIPFVERVREDFEEEIESVAVDDASEVRRGSVLVSLALRGTRFADDRPESEGACVAEDLGADADSEESLG